MWLPCRFFLSPRSVVHRSSTAAPQARSAEGTSAAPTVIEQAVAGPAATPQSGSDPAQQAAWKAGLEAAAQRIAELEILAWKQERHQAAAAAEVGRLHQRLGWMQRALREAKRRAVRDSGAAESDVVGTHGFLTIWGHDDLPRTWRAAETIAKVNKNWADRTSVTFTRRQGLFTRGTTRSSRMSSEVSWRSGQSACG